MGGAGACGGDAVEAPGGAAFFSWVDVFFASGKPAGALEGGQDWVKGAAGLAGEAHEFKAIALLLGVSEEDLDDSGRLGREFEVVGRWFHSANVAEST